MNKKITICVLSLFLSLFNCNLQAQEQKNDTIKKAVEQAEEEEKIDTVKVGVYITSLFDLSLPENSFSVDFWIWFDFQNDGLNPLESMEIANSKEVTEELRTTEKKGGTNWSTQKCKATIKKQWDIANFPFDKQHLEIVIEEAISDHEGMIYVADKENSLMDEKITIDGWHIKNFNIKDGITTYKTTYGDPLLKGSSSYPNILLSVDLERDGTGLFFKLFIGVYIAFAISILVFFIDPIDVDPRFGLSVGSLFAAVGNKYIVDSILPETITFTLVDKVHLLTFFFIFLSLIVSVKSLYWYKHDKAHVALRIDRIAFWVSLFAYIIINFILVYQAAT